MKLQNGIYGFYHWRKKRKNVTSEDTFWRQWVILIFLINNIKINGNSTLYYLFCDIGNVKWVLRNACSLRAKLYNEFTICSTKWTSQRFYKNFNMSDTWTVPFRTYRYNCRVKIIINLRYVLINFEPPLLGHPI